MNNITEPLRLAVGSHKAGSGKGCAMNVQSWVNGDSTITDMPDCADPFLARVVQRVNDTHCAHRGGSDLLCPPCSIEVLALADRTFGTRLDMPHRERARVYVQIAVEQAESVLHLATNERPRATCALVRRFLAGGTVTAVELHAAEYAAAANTAAAYAADAAAAAGAADAAAAAAANTDAAYAAATTAAAAADAYAYAANTDAAAAYAANRLSRAHRIIDRFEALTGVKAQPIAPEVTEAAVCAMVRK